MWGEVPLPEDLEAEKEVQASRSLLDDDEDFAADEASGGGLESRSALNSADMHSLKCSPSPESLAQSRYFISHNEH